MNAIIFTGPTLSAAEARQVTEATYLPPAAQGDVYRATLVRPAAIGIIDGVFDQVPSVWHKEILWAMSQGIHVFGAASMGALRAAELEAFGMTGVGEIFRSYHDGTLEDDDEVAVTHGKEADGFRVLSEAMVNIRRTLLLAQEEGIVGCTTRERLEVMAKNLHYPDRSYARVLQVAADNGLPSDELNALRAWLPKGKVDQKRKDAVEMLRVMRAIQEDSAPKVVNYKFENTVVWSALVNSAGLLHQDGSDGNYVSTNEILAELWADPELCLQAYQYAAIRHLIRVAVQTSGVNVSAEKIDAVEKAFRNDRGLAAKPDFDRWLRQHRMSAAQFAELIEHEALLHESSLTPCPFPHRWMLDWLRISGRYREVVAAAVQKKHSMEIESDDGNDPDAATEALLQWYVERLDSSNDAATASSRAMMNYLRKDWEAFLKSLIKRYRAQQRTTQQKAGG